MTDRDRLLDFCRQQLGKPYVLGATGPESFDCSGLFYAGLKQLFGASVPRISTDQYALGRAVDLAEVRPGDLVFFDTGWVERKPNHNGVCVDAEKMINANSHQAKVVEEVFADGYWSTRITGVRRIFDADGKLDLFGKSDHAPPFDDVSESHPFFAAIESLRLAGVVRGFEDGSFRPDQPVTRAEALKILLLCFEIPLSDAAADLFSDVYATDWHVTYVSTAYDQGIVNGYPDGSFRPNAEINRAEIAKIILETGGVSAPPTESDIPDVPAQSWFSGYATEALTRQMFALVAGRFLPGKPVTRGEMCHAIVRFMESADG